MDDNSVRKSTQKNKVKQSPCVSSRGPNGAARIIAREPVYRFPNELPIAGAPADVYAMATAYHDWLLQTNTPKLFFWAEPGALISPERAGWYGTHLKACKAVALGAGSHYVQEHHADAIGQGIAQWLPTLA